VTTVAEQTPADGVEDGGAPPPEEPPGDHGFDAWRRRSALGTAGSAVGRALGDLFAPAQNRPVQTAPIPGEPPVPPGGLHVVLDPDDPSKGVVVFREPSETGAGAVQPSSPEPDRPT
jgi:hypothetical protein